MSAFYFTKMHGLGNDFIVINALHQSVHLTAEQIIKLSNRHTGIGFDQCLLIEAPAHKDVDFTYRIFNANGQEVGQCGNGARCLARFIHHYQLSSKPCLTVATTTSRMQLRINKDNSVTVFINPPLFEPADIPLTLPHQQIYYHLPLNHITYPVHALHVGNPHAVLLVEDVDKAPVEEIGPLLSNHPLFPEQANISFMQIIDAHHIRLRVYERGAGETQACGSGAVAAAAVAHLYHNLSDVIDVELPGGHLKVEWPNLSNPIQLTGAAEFVYEGNLCANP